MTKTSMKGMEIKSKALILATFLFLGATLVYYAFNWEMHSETTQLLVFLFELVAIYSLKTFLSKRELEKKIIKLRETEEKVEHLAKEYEKFKLAVDSANDHVIIADEGGFIIYANRAAERVTGYQVKEMIGKKPGELWGGQMDLAFYKKLWHAIKEEGKPFEGVIKNKRKGGEMYDAAVSISPILDKEGRSQFYVGLERDITKELAVDRAKSEFVSLASHQLRTPLTAIKWYSDLLLAGKPGKLNNKQKEYLNEVATGNQRMITLVNDLLNISRMEMGTFEMKPVLADLCREVDTFIEELRPLADKKKINLIGTCGKVIPEIFVDVQMIRFIVQNLVSNSIKYTAEGGEVHVDLRASRKEATISVKDNGLGIPLTQHDKIFSKFFRADNVSRVDSDGSGLGLYIAKSMTEILGGKIWFESEEKKGSTFFVSIPANLNKQIKK